MWRRVGLLLTDFQIRPFPSSTERASPWWGGWGWTASPASIGVSQFYGMVAIAIALSRSFARAARAPSPPVHHALVKVSDVVATGGRVLFVGTKRQASEAIADAAKRSAQYFINHRWLGGTLTNWKTISQSIRRLKQLDETLAGEARGRTKKEMLQLTRDRDSLNKSLGGIKEMGGLPDLLFVIDTNKEQIAIAEAKKLGIPIVAIVDTNCNPDGIDFLVPGNDDAGRAITLYCDLIARAAIDGIERGQAQAGG